jgi:hypothetical protein
MPAVPEVGAPVSPLLVAALLLAAGAEASSAEASGAGRPPGGSVGLGELHPSVASAIHAGAPGTGGRPREEATSGSDTRAAGQVNWAPRLCPG